MAQQPIYVDLHLQGNQVIEAVLENVTSDPGTGLIAGRVIYNTTTNTIKFYDGSAWVTVGDVSITSGTTCVTVSEATPNNFTISISTATPSADGLMLGTDKAKLDASTSLNTPSTLVERDTNGDFSAGIITTAGSTGHSGVTLNGVVTNATDATTKAYVDGVAQGLSIKAPVKAATTANITLSGAQTIDGVSVVAGNRVLVKNQTLPEENGIYVAAAGAWSRSTDTDTWTELVSAFTFVSEGTVNGDIGYVCTVDEGGTIGVTAVTWVQFSSAGAYSAGAGITQTGTVFSITSSGGTLNPTTGNLDVKYDTTKGINVNTTGLYVKVDSSTTPTTAFNGSGEVVTSGYVPKVYATTASVGTIPGAATITHGLGTTNVMVTVKNASGQIGGYEVIVTGINTCTVAANGATQTVSVTVIGAPSV